MVRSSTIVVLIIWYCFGVFRVRAMVSDREQAGPSCAPSGPLPGTFLGTFQRNVSGTYVGHSVGEVV